MGILHLGERQRVRLFVRRDTLRALPLLPGLRAARPLQHREPAPHRARSCARRSTRTSIDYTTRVSESVLVRLHYMVYVEPGRRCPTSTRARSRRCSSAATRSWADDLEEALVEEHGEERGTALFRRYGDAFPPAYRADWVARSAVADIAPDRGARPTRTARAAPLPPARGAGRARCARSSTASGAPLALSDVLPLFENMGVKVADERPYAITPRERRAGLDLRLRPRPTRRRRARGRRASASASRTRFIRAWRGDVESDGYNRLVLRAGLDLARGRRCCARSAATCARPAPPSATATSRTALVAPPGRRARCCVELVPRPLRPRVARDAERGRRIVRAASSRRSTRSRASTRTASCAASSASSARRCAPTSSSATPTGAQAATCRSSSTRRAAAPGCPLPRPQLRDLRLLAARRGRAPARRHGRPRRAALVGPARGLPHRGARPDEGADGQERRDRAGRRQGRLRGQAAAGRRRPRGAARRGRGLLPHVHPRPARPHRQHRRRRGRAARRTSCATTATTPTSWSRPTRARRRFSDIANAIAVEYGFWLGDAFASGGSSGYDHKEMGITARGAWESVKRHFRELGHDVQSEDFTRRRHRRHVGRRVRQRDAAVARTSASSPRSTTAHIFLDPDPDAGGAASRSASACSSCRARRGPTTTAS